MLRESRHNVLEEGAAGLSGPTFALLLVLLPIVQILSFDFPSESKCFWEPFLRGVLRIFARSAVTGKSGGHSPQLLKSPLAELHTVYLNCGKSDTWEHQRGLLSPLLTLTPVKKVCITQPFTRWDGSLFPELYTPYAIEELELAGSGPLNNIRMHVWNDIMRQTPCLRSFKHSYDINSAHQSVHHWPVDALISCLRAHVKPTLEQVSLTISAASWRSGVTHTSVGLLRSFRHLKVLNLSAALLLR